MNRELLKSILQYLEKDGKEESKVACEMLRNAYNISSTSSSSLDLEKVWKLGCEKLGVTDVESDEKFKSFLKQLENMGYFNNTTATDTYENRYEKAKQKYLEKVKQQGGSGSSSQQQSTVDPEKAEKHKEEGNEKLRNRDFEGAVECYKLAMKHNPENHIYPSNMAAAYISLGQHEKAVKCCEQSIKLNENYVKSWQRLAQAQTKLSRKEDAIKSYQKLIELNPESKQEYEAKIEQLSQPETATNPFAGLGGLGGGGFNPFAGLGGGAGGLGGLGEMLNNPQFMQMAMNMMQQPGMQEMVSNMMQNMGGNPFAGMAGMGGGNNEEETSTNQPSMSEQQREVMGKILEEPEVKNNEKLTRVFTECRDNGPQALIQYMGDPEVTSFMMKYSSKLFEGAGVQNPFANLMGGNQSNNKDDDNNNSGGGNMYV
ncbi:hypothetical protein ABK040_015517 [Willaertia magna]